MLTVNIQEQDSKHKEIVLPANKKTANLDMVKSFIYNNLLMENPELFEKKISILQEISSAIVVTDNINAISNLMLDLAINYTNAEKGSLMLINERGELYMLAARGIDTQLIKSYKVRIGEGIAGTVAANRLPVLVKDIGKDERFKGKARDRYKTRSFISCPVVSKNKLLGVLNINDKKDNSTFTEDEFTLLKIITNQAAIALENAFLVNQLKTKATELEEINKKLIESDVVKTEFLTRVSHELRTPLNSINGAIYYLQHSAKSPGIEQKEFYDIISNETFKLTSIVENLLDFLRLEDETKVIKRSVINLTELMNEVLNLNILKTTLAKKNIHLATTIKEGISDIVGDRIRIVQFFINMMEGLSHYLEDADTIGIDVKENSSVNVTITFSRPLPETVLPYIFDSKHIFHTDQPEERLKLYLAMKVAESHKWNINTENLKDAFLVHITIPKSTRQKIETVVNTTMDMFIEFVSELLGLNVCSIMLSDELTGELTIKSARGLDDDVIKRTRIRFGDKIAGWVALEGKPLLIEDIESDPRFGKKSLVKYNTKSLLSLPLKMQDRVIGVLNLNNKETEEPFMTRDLYIASSISDQISFFMERLYCGEYNEDDYKQFIAVFEGLLSALKKYQKKKNIFPDMTFRIMDKIGANDEDKKLGVYVSMLYDLGLVFIDENVLRKKKLLSSEARTIKVHPSTTVSLLDNFIFSDALKQAILHHHERYDGTGYPDKLSGEAIPFVSRVLSVVDAFCSMTEARPYRDALKQEEALLEIKKGTGTMYDPNIVKALEEVLEH